MAMPSIINIIIVLYKTRLSITRVSRTTSSRSLPLTRGEKYDNVRKYIRVPRHAPIYANVNKRDALLSLKTVGQSVEPADISSDL